MEIAASYTEEEFAAFIEVESDNLELKNGTGRALQEPLVAFSNSEDPRGGAILIGVNDGRQVVGRRLDQGTADSVHEQAQVCRDVGRYSVREIQVGGRPVVAVLVERRVQGFAQTSQGRVLVRRGGRNVSLFGEDLVSFLNSRALSRFEAHETDLPVIAANESLMAEVGAVHNWDMADRDGLHHRLVERHLATPAGNLTIAGALFLTDPEQSLDHSKAVVEVRRYPGEGIDYDRRDTFGGPLHQQLVSVAKFVIDELGRDIIVSGLYRYDVPKLPEVVLREAIANAVAHRSYESAGAASVIELRPDRVVIRSPGGLPEPVTEENIRQAQSARNPVVLDILRRFRLAEDAGRGVDLIQDAMQEALLDPPEFIDQGATTEVVLPLLGPITPRERAWVAELEHEGTLQPGDRMALVVAARGHTLSNATVREATGVDAVAARQILQRLRDAGLLVQHGERGGARYTLAELVAPPAAYRMSPVEIRNLLLRTGRERPLTNQLVRDITGLDRPQVLAILRSLVEEGRLVRHGEKRGTYYTAK